MEPNAHIFPVPVGIRLLDEQHSELDRLFRRLAETLASDPQGALTEYRLGQLTEETSKHYQAEEEFIARAGFPDLGLHRMERTQILYRLQENLLQLDRPNAPALAELIREFAELTSHHMETADRGFAQWLQNRGLPDAPKGTSGRVG